MPYRNTVVVKSFYYKAADDFYVKDTDPNTSSKVLQTFEYLNPSIFKKPEEYDKNALPIAFRGGPDKLLVRVIKVINSWKLPGVYTWQIEEVCRWLRNYGYPQYQNTFRVNLVNGRTLLLLDASALSAINITNFDHIRHITYGIRCLFHFELTTFGRSISLAQEHYIELFKLLRVKNGTKYDNAIASNLWRRMQLIRPPEGLIEHWEALHRWLNFIPDSKPKELIGLSKHYGLYECRRKCEPPVLDDKESVPCLCMPPCECHWTSRESREPWMLSAIQREKIEERNREFSVLSVLYHSFPDRYKDRFVQKESFLRKL